LVRVQVAYLMPITQLAFNFPLISDLNQRPLT